MIVAAWQTGREMSPPEREMSPTLKVPQIYNITSGGINPITWGNIEKWALHSIYKYPMNTVLWYPGGSFKGSALYDRISRYMFHYLPAYVIDAILALFWQKTFMRKLVHKMTKSIEALQYFTINEWSWSDRNLRNLHTELVNTDQESIRDFDFDIGNLDWKKFLDNYVLGTRHYVLKDRPETMEKSK